MRTCLVFSLCALAGCGLGKKTSDAGAGCDANLSTLMLTLGAGSNATQTSLSLGGSADFVEGPSLTYVSAGAQSTLSGGSNFLMPNSNHMGCGIFALNLTGTVTAGRVYNVVPETGTPMADGTALLNYSEYAACPPQVSTATNDWNSSAGTVTVTTWNGVGASATITINNVTMSPQTFPKPGGASGNFTLAGTVFASCVTSS